MLVIAVHSNLQLTALQHFVKCAVEINVYVCLQPLNWRHTICHLPFSKTQTTWDWVTWQELEGRNNFFDFSVTRAISPLFPSNYKSMNLKDGSGDGNILSCTCQSVSAWMCAWERGNEKSKNKYTVRMVGVTKAQQILQNRFGWKPIIISMSSQNLCRPAARKEKSKEKLNKRREMEES